MLPNLIVALYALLPVALLTSASLPSGVFYALIAACLALLVQKRFAGAREQTYRYRWLIASYSVLFLAVASSSIYYGDWAGANSEGALRFFLGLWVLLLALPHVGAKKLRHALWGVYFACLISSAVVLELILTGDPRPETPGLILTTYTSIMILLGAVTLYSLKWRLTPWPKAELLLKVVVFALVFGAFLLTQTRTGLLAVPLLVLLGLILFVGLHQPKRLLGAGVVAGLLMVGAIASSSGLRDRIADGVDEVLFCQGAQRNDMTSLCIRMQLWRSAIDAGQSNPWVGLGDGSRYADYLADVALPKGLVSESTVELFFGEPHNDYLLYFAAFGFPGLLGLVVIYLVPCIYLLPRLLRESSPQALAAVVMALSICLGFAFFGLSETMFRRMNTMGFYVAMLGLFCVLSDSARRADRKSSGY